MKILVADQQHVIAAGVQMLFRCDLEVEICAARSCAEAERLSGHYHPHMILWGLELPQQPALGAVECVFGSSDRVLVFADRDDPLLARRALMMGARGFISKQCALAEVREAVLEVAAGREYVHPNIVQALALIEVGQGEAGAPGRMFSLEVLKRLVSGQTLPQIAHDLNVSYKSATRACAQMRRELGATNQCDLLIKAIARGLIAVERTSPSKCGGSQHADSARRTGSSDDLA